MMLMSYTESLSDYSAGWIGFTSRKANLTSGTWWYHRCSSTSRFQQNFTKSPSDLCILLHLSIHQQTPTFSHGWPTAIHINGLQQLRHQSLKQWHVHEWQPWNDDLVLVTNKSQQQHFEMFVPCASHESGVMCHESELPGTVPWHSSIDLNQNGMSHGSCLFHIPLPRLRYPTRNTSLIWGYINHHFCQFSLILNPYYFVGQGGKRGYKQPWMLSRTNTNAPHNLPSILAALASEGSASTGPVIKHGRSIAIIRS